MADAEARIREQHYEECVELSRLRPAPVNPNRGDKETIWESISANGFFGAVLAWQPPRRKTGSIIGGENRWRQAREHGLECIPVLWIDDIKNQEEADAILLVDNEAARRGANEPTQLVDLLAHLQAQRGLLGTGYTDEGLGDLLATLATPSTFEPVDPSEQPRLDELEPRMVVCPHCSKTFDSRVAEIPPVES